MLNHEAHGNVSTIQDFASLLANVADEYSEKLADGEHPDIEDYARQHPTIADAIRRVLPALNAAR